MHLNNFAILEQVTPGVGANICSFDNHTIELSARNPLSNGCYFDVSKFEYCSCPRDCNFIDIGEQISSELGIHFESLFEDWCQYYSMSFHHKCIMQSSFIDISNGLHSKY